MINDLEISENIEAAETLPAIFYQSQEVFDLIRERVFVRSWHWVGMEKDLLPFSESVFPLTLFDGYLDEPIVLVKNAKDEIITLSNVCTHRANIVVEHAGRQKQLACMYHGRRYNLDGTFKMMPEFSQAKNFPRPCDDLHLFSSSLFKGHIFSSLDKSFDFDEVTRVMQERIGFLPLEVFKLNETISKDYLINCNWALYCDNYLEGFHIPFVHPDLNDALDYGSYETVLYDYCNLQIGYSSGGEEVFDLPEGHPDFGKQVGAYYYWIFPNMMFNFYPWGLSINIVKPVSINRTRVSFVSYVYDESKLSAGAGALLDKVEREDEYVVEGVHKGLKSRFYKAGRFSPTKERGVHHFQRLLLKFLKAN